ncbi:death-inducer obliterator 1-like isoform X2 [Varroa jacobsoni]|uniref:death-inducer obliterator 1-like isoform X2 n=1 Tax=Varroa jacobsoni TaxID=62625 RepID=UPI000BF6B897|nr:death-inducer obliterator 1-like isoform X2 [Varroa jacobsoni]
MSTECSPAFFCDNETEGGVALGTPAVMSNSHNGPSAVFGPGVGGSVGAEDSPEIDEMLSAVSTTTLELHELESLVLDDNQQLFGQEVTLTTDILSSSDQSVQLDHCYAQPPSADPLPSTDTSRTSKTSKRGAKRSADNGERVPAKQANKQGVLGRYQQSPQHLQVSPQQQSSINVIAQQGHNATDSSRCQAQQSCSDSPASSESVVRPKGKNPPSSKMLTNPVTNSCRPAAILSKDDAKESSVATTLENALTPQELDAVSAAVARLHSTTGLGTSECPEITRENTTDALSSSITKVCAIDTARMKSPGAVCSSARPSRKSKEKFQRNLERKRQMGKNIEDYVSDDSEDNEQRKLPKLLGAKQSRRQRGLLGQVHLVTTSSTIPQPRRSGTGLAQQRTRLPNAVPAGLQKDLGTLSSSRRSHARKSMFKCGNRNREGGFSKWEVKSDVQADLSSSEVTDEGAPDDDDEWNSDNDPEKLWCVCHKPHNNQFMIACDECENWFHGRCVGVSKAEGARMEKTGHEWFCSNCRKKRNGQSGASSATGSRISSNSGSRSTGAGLGPCGAELSVPLIDNLSPHPLVSSAMVGNYTVLGQCASCKKVVPGEPTHRFCNVECTSRHVNKYLPAIIERAEKEGLEVRVSMVEISTGKAINLVNATVDGTEKWLCRRPTFQINPNQASAIRRPVPKNKHTEDSKEKECGSPNKTSNANSLDENKCDIVSRDSSVPSSTNQSHVGASSRPALQHETTSSHNITTIAHKNVSLTAGSSSSSSNLSSRKGASLIAPPNKTASSKTMPDRKGNAKLANNEGTPTDDSTTATSQSLAENQGHVHNPPLAQARKNDPKVIAKKSSPVPTNKPRIEQRRRSLTSADSGNAIVISGEKQLQQSSAWTSTPASKQHQTQLQISGHQQQSTNEDARRNGVNALARIVRERCEREGRNEKGTSQPQLGDHAGDAATSLAQNIERALWTHCAGVAKNYRVKFRSLCFNMKDPKNELWRRVVSGEIEPTQLVKMGPDELSIEMARWRERESQHNLELYKKEAAINVTDKDALQLLADAAPLADECRGGPSEKKNKDSRRTKVGERITEKDNYHGSREKKVDKKTVKEKEKANNQREKERGRNNEKNDARLKDKDRNRKCARERTNGKETGSKNSADKDKDKPVLDRPRLPNNKESSTRRSIEASDKEQKQRDSREHNNRDTFKVGDKEDKMDTRELERAQKIIDRVRALERCTSSTSSASPFALTNPHGDEECSGDEKSAELPLSPNMLEDVAVLWEGAIRMDPAHFSARISHAAGPVDTGFEIGLPDSLVICGNIQPAGVKDYLARLKHANKDIIVVRVKPASTDEGHADDLLEIIRMLKARSRLGVVQEMKHTRVKDLYMLPLESGEQPPGWFPYYDKLHICDAACLLGLAICHKKGQPTRRGSRSTTTGASSGVSYEPSMVGPAEARVRVDINSIEDAERMLIEKPGFLSQNPIVSGESSLSVLSSLAAQQGTGTIESGRGVDEAYDPEVEWA